MDLSNVFNEAINDDYAVTIKHGDSVGVCLYGVKILKDNNTSTIKLFNIGQHGDYYNELSVNNYKVFIKKGWRYGVYYISLQNYRSKISLLNKMIRDEMNGRKNPKKIKSLDNNRKRYLEMYSKVVRKFNLIK